MKTGHNKSAYIGATFAAIFLLVGCSSPTSEMVATSNGPTTSSDGNLPPTISGIPGSSTTVGQAYGFTPVASDPNGDVLTFSIQNIPPWANFDSGTGVVSGVPNIGDTGTYSDISISVSDGKASVSLPLFSVAVNQIATGSTTLSWTPPTQNNDGSPLMDLAGYKIYYGVSEGNYPNQILIDNPGITSYVVDNLSPNTYYFVSTSLNAANIESDLSNTAILTIN